MTKNNDNAGMRSPLDAALRYAERGWPVFPLRSEIDPKTGHLVKSPHTANGFHDATTDVGQIVKWWRELPNAQVGVACGPSGICVIDLDLDHARNRDGVASWSRLKDENGLDGCGLIASTPRGGRHYVYLMPDPPAQCGVDIIPGSGIDVRADGGYIVVPSPASPGREWVVGDPFEVSEGGTTDLCAMPAWVRALVFDRRSAGRAQGAESGRAIPIDDKQLAAIRAALQHIDNDSRDNWIKVGMALKSTGARDQAFELWEAWSMRGEGDSVHPKFDPKDQAYQWRSIHEYRMNGSEITLGTLFHMARQGGWAPTLDEEIAVESSPAPAEPAAPRPARERPFPLELMNCPGLVGEMAAWMVQNSPRRQPALCLASAIASLGALLGRRVATPSDLRTNVYALGIGETACGKGTSIKLPQLLFSRAGLDKHIGPGEWKSDSGLRAALVAEPAHVCLIDEFTKSLEAMAGTKVPPHIKGIKRYILELFSAANGVHLAPAYADRQMNKPTPIGEPNLCIYGTGVPNELFLSLDRGAIGDGFLNRFLVFFSDEAQPKRQVIGRVVPPVELVDALKKLDHETKPTGNLAGMVGEPAIASGCRTVPMDDEANALWNELVDENDRRLAGMAGNPLSDLWVRFGEHIAKLALIRSVCDSPSRAICAADILWARDLVVWCTERTMAVAEARVADSQQEALTKRVRRVIASYGADGITLSGLTRATQWLRRSDRKDIIQTLMESGQVVSIEHPSNGGRAATSYADADFLQLLSKPVLKKVSAASVEQVTG